MAADSVKAGAYDIVIAGGVESMSMVPMGGNKLIAYPDLIVPRAGLARFYPGMRGYATPSSIDTASYARFA